MGIRRQFAVARQFSEVGVYGGYHEVYCCAKAVQAVGDHRPKKRIQQILLNPFFVIVMLTKIYMASATTSVTSGTMRFNKPSIPALSVMVDEGQPLHEPFNSTVTTPSWKDL